MNIKEILSELENNSNFEIMPACGYPKLKEGHVLPKDLREFYGMCGGIKCYTEFGGFPIEILSPDDMRLANILLLGSDYADDISSTWYVIADAEDGNYISIDCSSTRLGRCYESFEYTHAVAGNCCVVALSFTELLNNILEYQGEYFFWKDNSHFVSHGDAYDC